MALVMTPIYTRTVGAGGTSAVTFNNIPQFYTDLVVKTSIRSSFNMQGFTYTIRFNGSTSGYSHTTLNGTGVGVNSFRDQLSYGFMGSVNEASTTANTFTSNEVYIPNYSGNQFKQFTVDNVTENNGSVAYAQLLAQLWSSTSAITSITIDAFAQPIVQHSTFSLYGIIRSGA